mmetsp:Transcript_98083/g.280685  ORF Transcript_98083/g.280685 Transcript_98083/m.280685 type:complete len:253 (+) Transcript_98083:833-1591(+)
MMSSSVVGEPPFDRPPSSPSEVSERALIARWSWISRVSSSTRRRRTWSSSCSSPSSEGPPLPPTPLAREPPGPSRSPPPSSHVAPRLEERSCCWSGSGCPRTWSASSSCSSTDISPLSERTTLPFIERSWLSFSRMVGGGFETTDDGNGGGGDGRSPSRSFGCATSMSTSPCPLARCLLSFFRSRGRTEAALGDDLRPHGNGANDGAPSSSAAAPVAAAAEALAEDATARGLLSEAGPSSSRPSLLLLRLRP